MSMFMHTMFCFDIRKLLDKAGYSEETESNRDREMRDESGR